jgi:Na+-translocating ferredoxin:NAD+ oxidoreductase RnfG subunit
MHPKFFTINLLVMVFLLFPPNGFSQEIKERTEDVIKNVLGEDAAITYDKYTLIDSVKEKIELMAKQRFFNEFVYVLRIYNNQDLKAVAFLDNVLGKELPITFLVIIDKPGKIISTDIIKYREPYGGAVQSASWTSQFLGKNNESNYTVGDDIDGISGATISVKSITKGIQKLSLLYQEIKNTLWNSSYTDLIEP